MPLPHKKNFLRDVLPKNTFDRPSNNRYDVEEEVKYQKIVEPADIAEKEHRTRGGKWQIWAVASVAILALTGAVLYAFGGAEVTVRPRVDEAKFNDDFTARKDDFLDNWTSGLTFTVQKIEKLGTKNVTADGEKMQQVKATGVITVYNAYTTSDQKLIKNTRFQTPEGLVYRIDQSIIVPGKKTVDGEIVPGSVEAKVTADEIGTKYNIGSSSFTLPAFKSDPGRFSGFYAKSSGPMTGGFSGVAKFVSDAKQREVRAEIRSQLEKQILAEAQSSLKTDTFMPKGAYTVEFESQPPVPAEGGAVSISEKATVAVYVFNTTNWDIFLSQATPFASAVGSSTVKIENRNDLDLIWKSRPNVNSAEVSFTVKGSARFIWVPDDKMLAASLSGVKRGDLQKVLGKFNEVLSATASFTPFWSAKFPKDTSKIHIKTDIP